MTALLEVRESLKSFYTKHEIYLKPLIKFIVALISLVAINSYMGYMKILGEISIVLVVALMCSFMPSNFIVVVSALFILAHSYALSLECAIVLLAVMAVMFLLYFRYSPKDTLVVLLTPILFILKIPYVMPVALGLLGGPASIISVSCGTIVYYIIKFMSDNISTFSATDAETGSLKLKIMIDGIIQNKAMLVTVIVFAITLLIVHVVRRLSIDHAWTIAIFSGISISVVLLLVCEFLFELRISVSMAVIGGIISLVICMAIEFLEFNVDYNRTELVQFEDDEYYYYVKAVPKNTLTAPEKSVKKINKHQKRVPVKSQDGNMKGSTVVRPTASKIGERPVVSRTIKTANGVSRASSANQNDKKKS